MRRLLLTIQYDGSAYHGWQVQQNAVTVQEVFQNAVEKLFGKRLDFLTIDHNRFGYIYEIRGLLSPYCFFSHHKYSENFISYKYL